MLKRIFFATCAFLFLSSAFAEQRTGVFRGRTLKYEAVDGLAVFEGDIILELDGPSKSFGNDATIITSERYRWINATIPYTIDSKLGIVSQINQAIKYWNDNTPIKMVPRSTEQNYVRFAANADPNAPVCSSSVGMLGGAQNITLVSGCSVGSIIHEIGHAVGLWHEQSRQDRNAFVTVLYDHIQTKYAFNFDQNISDGTDVGPYNFASIMHYGATDFTKDGLPTIETVPPGIPFGQRTGLSLGDIDAVKRMYGVVPQVVTVATNPSGLQFTVDGSTYNTAQTFTWADGTTHTVGVTEVQGSGQSRNVFGAWSDAGAATHVVKADSSLSVLVANFRSQYRVSVSSGAGGMAQISPTSPDGYYDLRTSVEILAVPDPGYEFVTWDLGASGSANPKVLSVASAAVPTASFSKNPVTTIITDPPGLPLLLNGGRYTSPQGFTLPSGTHTLGVDISSSDSDIRYAFGSWSNGGTLQQTIQAPKVSTIFTATIVPSYRLTSSPSPDAGGLLTANPASSNGFYDSGATVGVTATPSSGYNFFYWDGDLYGGGLTRNITMTDPRVVTAVFTRQSFPYIMSNAASYDFNSVSPGQLVTIFGAGIGPATPASLEISGGKVTTSLQGTRILFDGVPAPLTYVSENQVSAVAPFGIAGKSTTSVVPERNGVRMAGSPWAVAPATPAIFTLDSSGRGPGSILNEDNTINTPANPAGRNSVVVIYATGGGTLAANVPDGQVIAPPYPALKLPVSVRIGGRPAEVLYAGAAPGLVSGVLQVNARIPEGIVAGTAVPVNLVVGAEISPPGVTIAVKPAFAHP